LISDELDSFSIHPDLDLLAGRDQQSPASLLARVIAGLESLFEKERPDLVLIQGDTTTTLAAALAAFYERIPIVHLEAGLRSYNISSPFPEEAHRLLISRIANLHLAPTQRARAALLAEGLDPNAVICVGNTVVDALRLTLVSHKYSSSAFVAEEPWRIEGRRIVLATVHRRESWGDKLLDIGTALARIAEEDANLLVVIPLHPNPEVRKTLEPVLKGIENVMMVESLSHVAFVRLLQAAELVLTDSGGIQEECPTLGKPVLVLRDATERTDALDAGSAMLVGTEPNKIVAAAKNLLYDPVAYSLMAQPTDCYGDGFAADRALNAILWKYSNGERPNEFDWGNEKQVSFSPTSEQQLK
jgi:UDP-N-acetylglucosamine 2-epimerase (non-hydrolysing)